ncbi:Hypothetical protein c5458 [Escherichia coli CFT073]|uniref:Uncharacterized protein n=1 Tax=Escherichia coli O6:H1 (strain CFT073 / ATCC 700928 / UPEC) TaxID=199310 RepID=A0A0H2VDT6_ECOL6|nr:Hypothetical protein c5458 [Escherichia coli CFT073]
MWCTSRLPTKFGRSNYDELLSFQIIFNAFHTIYRFGDTFSTVALCLRIYGTGELDHAIGGFNFHMTGRDNVICQQFGFDFTGSGGVTRVAFHRAFFSVANVQFVADRGHALNTFRHFHRLFGLSLAFNETAQGHDFLIGFDRDIGALDVVMIHQGRLHFRGDGAVIHEITDFIHRAIDFLPCAFIGSLRVVFCVGRAGRDGRGQHYSQQSFRNLQSCHSHRFIPVCLLVI